LLRFLVPEEFVLLLLLENVYLFVFILVVAVVGRSPILGLSTWKLRLTRGQVQRIVVLDGVFFVFVDDFRDLFDCVACHLAEMILDFKLGRVLLRGERKVEIVFVVPVEPLEAKLFLCQDLLRKDT